MATVTGTKRHLVIESDTLNTGQGANELYDMDQNVTTTSDVTFANISATSINVTSITSSIVTSSILKTEGSNIFGDASNDTHAFNGNITVTGTVDGRDIATDGTKLDGIASSANNYSLPLASSTRGGVKIGYTENGKNYPVELSNEKMFVNVPWTDTNTTYSVGDGGLTQNNFTDTLKSKLDGIATSANNYSLPLASSTRGGVKVGYTENGKNYPVELSSEKMYVNVPWTDTNTTYSVGDGGLTQKNFTTTLKTKLDGISTGADVTPSWVPSSNPNYLTNSSTQTKYLRSDANDTANNLITFNGGLNGRAVSGDAGGSDIYSLNMPQNPEGRHVRAPWFFNDMAFARLRGTTITAVVNGGSNGSNSNIDAMLDASTGFWNVSTSGVSSVVVTIGDGSNDLPKTFQHGTNIGVTFGNTTWRAQTVKIETYRSGAWEEEEEYTSNGKEMLVKYVNYGGDTISRIRYTFSNFNSTSMRIVSLFAYNYNAVGMPSLYLTKDGGAMYGPITTNSTIDGRDIATDGAKLDTIATSANNYSLPLAASGTRGGVKVGYSENGKNYPVELSSEKMYVNVPWTDTNTTYSVGDGGLTQNNFTDTLKSKLDGIASSANNYSLPAGSSSTRGGFKIGYSENGKNYPVEVSSEKMYVNVPWTDTNDNTQLSTEQVQDIVGAMFSSNTETRVAATYDDTSGKIDIVVDDMTADTDTTYSVGDGGLTQKNFTTTLKTKLDGIATSANNYSLPLAASGTRGGVKIGYSENGKNYPVELSSEKMYVNVPWTDTNTTYSVGDGGLTQNNFTDTLKSKLDGISTSADVTDATTVAAAGALMDSEVTNLAEVKAFDSSDYATAAQGTKADTAHGWGNHASAGYGTSNLALGTTSTTALAGNTTTISTAQANAITANSAKRGISSDEQSAIVANTAKTGITTTQANAITANTAKRDARYIYFPVVANFSGNINTAQYVPLSDGETESTSDASRRNNFVAPGAGEIVKVIVRSNASLYDRGRGVTLTGTLQNISDRQSTVQSTATATTTTTATNFKNILDFSEADNRTFAEGDRLLVSLQAPLNATKNYYVTVVFKLDQNDID